MPTVTQPLTAPDRAERLYRDKRLYAERIPRGTGSSAGCDLTWIMVHDASSGFVSFEAKGWHEGPLEELLTKLERIVDDDGKD